MCLFLAGKGGGVSTGASLLGNVASGENLPFTSKFGCDIPGKRGGGVCVWGGGGGGGVQVTYVGAY